MLKKTLLLLIMGVVFWSCVPEKQQVDAIYYNAFIYTVDSSFTFMRGGFAIKDGKFVEIDSSHKILLKYDAAIKEDLNEKFIYPGFYDAHCHFLGYAKSLNQVNLVGTQSLEEVIEKVVDFRKLHPETAWITGRGWDQNDWIVKEFPNNERLNELFPDIPLLIRRVDGHGALANQKALDLAGITKETQIVGGMIEVLDGKLTGILVDNAVDLVLKIIPEPSHAEKTNALIAAQKNCFEVGLTTVDDAGLDLDDIMLMDSLQKAGILKMNIYAMLNPGVEEFEFAKQNGFYQTEKMNVRSFKIYADGALGSRGACLKEEYSDKAGHLGFLLSSQDTLMNYASRINTLGFQMNTHCIGDSANATLLNICGSLSLNQQTRRWRIEHAQVIDPEDMEKFAAFGVLPSVQPTHCTSDMYWAEDRLGPERIKGAYAYNTLLNQYGMIASGSDFPIESINPLFGFYAAIARKDQKNYPEEGFYKEEAITREQALKTMTIWAAYANFEEGQKGSIEVGKNANFVVLEEDLLTMPENMIFGTSVYGTYVNGEQVFEKRP